MFLWQNYMFKQIHVIVNMWPWPWVSVEGVGGDVGDREAGVVQGEGSDEVCTETMVILTL